MEEPKVIGNQLIFKGFRLPVNTDFGSAVRRFNSGVDCWCHGARPLPCPLVGVDNYNKSVIPSRLAGPHITNMSGEVIACHDCLLCANYPPPYKGYGDVASLKRNLFAELAMSKGYAVGTRGLGKSKVSPNEAAVWELTVEEVND